MSTSISLLSVYSERAYDPNKYALVTGFDLKYRFKREISSSFFINLLYHK